MLDVDVERSTGTAEAVSVYSAGWSNGRQSTKTTFGSGSGSIVVGPEVNLNKQFIVAKASASGTALWAVRRVEVHSTLHSFV